MLRIVECEICQKPSKLVFPQIICYNCILPPEFQPGDFTSEHYRLDEKLRSEKDGDYCGLCYHCGEPRWVTDEVAVYLPDSKEIDFLHIDCWEENKDQYKLANIPYWLSDKEQEQAAQDLGFCCYKSYRNKMEHDFALTGFQNSFTLRRV